MDTSNKVIVFLGAGASAFAGYRTFAGFPGLLFRDHYNGGKNLKPDKRNNYDLLREVESQLGRSRRPKTHDQFLLMLTHYLELWKTLRVDSILRDRFLASVVQFSDFDSFYRIVEKTIQDITEFTVKHYSENRISKNLETAANVYNFYKYLGQINSKENPYLSVFTTNYDFLIEDLFQRFAAKNKKSFQLINGFAECTLLQTKIAKSNCNDHCFWSDTSYKNSKRKGFHLFRLHGCVSWHLQDSTNVKVQCKRAQAQNIPQQTLRIVMPGFHKPGGTGPQGYGFKKLALYLSTCKILLIVGFSFQDDDIVHLILSVNFIREKPFKIVIVDPVIQKERVLKALQNAKDRNTFPSSLPNEDNIICVNVNFGKANFEDKIKNTIKELLREEDNG